MSKISTTKKVPIDRIIGEKVLDFFNIVNKLKIDIHNDQQWPMIADNIIKKISTKNQVKFWEKMEKEFKGKEKKIDKCHKGHIYWKLALLHLNNKTIKTSLKYLKFAQDEDRNNLKREDTASFLLASIVEPLLNVVNYNSTSSKLFNNLSSDEDANFFEILKQSHNYSALSQTYQIALPPNKWTFILNKKRREVISQIYFECLGLLTSPVRYDTYYSVVFSIGSIIEGFLDDIFTRKKQMLWNKFINNKTITKLNSNLEDNHPLILKKYPEWATLGIKIEALEMLSNCSIKSIPSEKILQMLIIRNYRNLIHPFKMIKFDYLVNYYIANFLFTFIPHIAGELWPKNFMKNKK